MARGAGTRLPSPPHDAPLQSSVHHKLIDEKFQRQAEAVLGVTQAVLGEHLLGAYLHGSAVLGGIRPTSDVDVLTVVSRATTRVERARLIQKILPISGPPEPAGQWRPVELTVVTQADVKPWRYPPRMQFQYGEWLRADYERGFVPRPGPNPDLAPLITVVLTGNRPLMGPPPSQMLDTVPAVDLGRAIRAGVPELLADLEPDTRNVLLTLARIWHTTETGQIVAKDVAAVWAAARLPSAQAEIVRRAADQYVSGTHGEHDWPAAMAAVRAAAATMVAEIEMAGS